MAVPKHRRTSSDKRRRAAHFGLDKTNAGVCRSCSAPVVPHRACKNCGAYKGQDVIDTKRDSERALKKAQMKAAMKAPAEEEAKEAPEAKEEKTEGNPSAENAPKE